LNLVEKLFTLFYNFFNRIVRMQRKKTIMSLWPATNLELISKYNFTIWMFICLQSIFYFKPNSIWNRFKKSEKFNFKKEFKQNRFSSTNVKAVMLLRLNYFSPSNLKFPQKLSEMLNFLWRKMHYWTSKRKKPSGIHLMKGVGLCWNVLLIFPTLSTNEIILHC
jgi:hypothetical protein